MEEIWKDIEGYEGLYQVSNLGRVRSLDRIDALGNHRKEKILSTKNNTKTRYPRVCLCKNGKHKLIVVHRLVALTFIPNSEPLIKTQVGHKDETRTNNRVDNLEWVTPKENSNTPLHRHRVAEANIGKIFSEEHKEKLSKSRLGKYQGKENPFYNKHHSEEAKKKMSETKKKTYQGGNHPQAKKVICERVEYGSTAEASLSLGVNRSTLKSWLNGKNKMPSHWVERGLKYKDD